MPPPFWLEPVALFVVLALDRVKRDVDFGLVAGWRITKNLGVFVEGTYLEYWEKPIQEFKFGFNYLIF